MFVLMPLAALGAGESTSYIFSAYGSKWLGVGLV